MPLNPKASVSHNISEMVHAGHPQNQAIAAALNVARNAKAMGGAEDGNPRQLNSMGLYSQAAEVAKSLPQARGTPQQMVASLKGIKQDELTNSNVMGTFGNQPYVTRDQLVQHFQKSLPNIEEKQIKGGGIDENRKKNWILKNAIDSAVDSGDIDHVRDWDDTDNDVKNWHTEIANNEFNKNYFHDASFKDNFLKENATKYEEHTIPNGTDYRELLLKLKGSPLYRSSHWENDPNVIVHLRMKDRDEGKTLHLEELQSDWGQDYRKSEAEPAPYITSTNSWTDLGLKRALIEAAKGGHERLTWTPGLHQAKRYNLSDEKQQGMKGYYDNILPSRLKDIIKRLGHEPKFEPYNINNEIPAQSLRITPELRQTILKGISAFERGGYVPYATGGGLYANIHAKQERIAHGSHEHMRRPGVKGAPTAEAFRASERTAKADGGGPITAYQGGPHSVGPEGYSNEKIGTGEGRQVFGYGHYFAEHEPNSQYYRDKLTPVGQTGHMHEVDIHAHPNHFLDWDKPIKDQPHIIKNVMTPELVNQMNKFRDLYKAGDIKPDFSNITGEDLYAHLSQPISGVKGNDKAASEHLLSNNVKGIKYFDEGSRAASKGTRNYVVFDPKDIEIMRRYAQGGDVSTWHSNHPIHRTAKADGGDFSNNQKLRQIPQLNHLQPAPTMGNKVVVHEGPIHSPVAGRTDHLPMHVKSGSYVIPADIIGAMGEGNTMAGFKVARRMFSSNPYFQKSMSPYGSSSPIYNSDEKPYGARAAGGGTPGIGHNGAPQDDEDDDLVPIVAAGGEYVISPQDVTRLGEDDIDDGHKTLDSFVTKYRKKTIKVLQNLPGPKRD